MYTRRRERSRGGDRNRGTMGENDHGQLQIPSASTISSAAGDRRLCASQCASQAGQAGHTGMQNLNSSIAIARSHQAAMPPCPPPPPHATAAASKPSTANARPPGPCQRSQRGQRGGSESLPPAPALVASMRHRRCRPLSHAECVPPRRPPPPETPPHASSTLNVRQHEPAGGCPRVLSFDRAKHTSQTGWGVSHAKSRWPHFPGPRRLQPAQRQPSRQPAPDTSSLHQCMPR
jgi:hypothetical protein